VEPKRQWNGPNVYCPTGQDPIKPYGTNNGRVRAWFRWYQSNVTHVRLTQAVLFGSEVPMKLVTPVGNEWIVQGAMTLFVCLELSRELKRGCTCTWSGGWECGLAWKNWLRSDYRNKLRTDIPEHFDSCPLSESVVIRYKTLHSRYAVSIYRSLNAKMSYVLKDSLNNSCKNDWHLCLLLMTWQIEWK
jgi:hypothetical protein